MKHKMPQSLLDFFREQCDSVNMLVVAFSDYIASRACMRFNCLFQAAILGEQALEKAFKAGLRLSGDSRPFKKMSHNLCRISKRLGQESWFNYDPHKSLIEALEYHFKKSRYPPTKEDAHYLECLNGISREEFQELDYTILEYYDALPVPDEVRFRLGVYRELHIKKLLEEKGLPSLTWDALCCENAPLERRLPEMKKISDQYFERFKSFPLPGWVAI